VLEWKVMREIHGPIKNGDGRWRIRTNEEIQGEHKVFPCFLVINVCNQGKTLCSPCRFAILTCCCNRMRWNDELYGLYNEPNIVEDIKIRRLQ